MKRIIGVERSIVPACDAPLDIYKEILEVTGDLAKVGAYKLGFYLGLTYGLPDIVELTREYTDKPIIYDHQKAGTDIPDTGKKFAEVCSDAGIDAIILFPQSGPETLKAWIDAAKDAELGIIVGGKMTHPKYVASEGGFILDESAERIYMLAAEQGVREFVVPGNDISFIEGIRKKLDALGIEYSLYAPGFVAQGGSISDAGKIAGKSWHAIVGRGLYESDDIENAALKLTSQI